eukprot:gb/GECG01010591.1/.p1 GENE.gb/GECG01010591.1/~~gb/GECG01010591.1/.p1  ORF type:complete len:445 (+),score=34.86 gb/GECG01010591.1/:1-1335(+)
MGLSSMDLKILSGVFTFVMALIGAFAALLLYKKPGLPVSAANTGAAGVFLSAGLVHLLPDAVEEINTDFPWAYVMCGIGFLVTLLIEQTAGVWHHQRHCDEHENQEEAFHHHHYRQDDAHCQDAGTAIGKNGLVGHEDEETNQNGSWSKAGCTEKCEREGCYRRQRVCNEGIMTPLQPDTGQQESSMSPVEYLLGPGLVSLILALALGFHSFFAGIALGSDESNSEVHGILVAILAHKGLAAYALANNLSMTGASKAQLWTITILFSLVTPLGILIGAVLDETVGKGQWTSFIIAMASGVFLYVGIVELLMHELGDTHVHSHADSHVANENTEAHRCLSIGRHESLDLDSPGPISDQHTGLNPQCDHSNGESHTTQPLHARLEMGRRKPSKPSHENHEDHHHHSQHHHHEHEHPERKVTFFVVGIKLTTLCIGFAVMTTLALWV